MQALPQASTRWPRRGPLSAAHADFEEIDPPPFLLDGEYERVVRIADLELDPEWHAVSRGGQQITLTRIQFQLLAVLAEHLNDVVDYDVLVAEAWGHSGEDFAGESGQVAYLPAAAQAWARAARYTGHQVQSGPRLHAAAALSLRAARSRLGSRRGPC